jgi:hypothetical protein
MSITRFAHARQPYRVSDKDTWWLMVPTAAFYNLLRRPLGRWMLSYLDMHDFAAGMAYHEEDMQRPEEKRLYADEVTSPDPASVLLEKDAPPRRWLSPTGTTHVLGDRSSRDFVPQPCQFRLDPPLPHKAFSEAIRRMSNLSSPEIGCRPLFPDARDRQRQYDLQRLRCQPNTVSGLTMSSDLRQPENQRHARIQKRRSASLSRDRGCRR